MVGNQQRAVRIKIKEDGTFDVLGMEEDVFRSLFPNFAVEKNDDGSVSVKNLYRAVIDGVEHTTSGEEGFDDESLIFFPHSGGRIRCSDPSVPVSDTPQESVHVMFSGRGIVTPSPVSSDQPTTWLFFEWSWTGKDDVLAPAYHQNVGQEDKPPSLKDVANAMGDDERDSVKTIIADITSVEVCVDDILSASNMFPNLESIEITVPNGDCFSEADFSKLSGASFSVDIRMTERVSVVIRDGEKARVIIRSLLPEDEKQFVSSAFSASANHSFPGVGAVKYDFVPEYWERNICPYLPATKMLFDMGLPLNNVVVDIGIGVFNPSSRVFTFHECHSDAGDGICHSVPGATNQEIGAAIGLLAMAVNGLTIPGDEFLGCRRAYSGYAFCAGGGYAEIGIPTDDAAFWAIDRGNGLEIGLPRDEDVNAFSDVLRNSVEIEYSNKVYTVWLIRSNGKTIPVFAYRPKPARVVSDQFTPITPYFFGAEVYEVKKRVDPQSDGYSRFSIGEAAVLASPMVDELRVTIIDSDTAADILNTISITRTTFASDIPGWEMATWGRFREIVDTPTFYYNASTKRLAPKYGGDIKLAVLRSPGVEHLDLSGIGVEAYEHSSIPPIRNIHITNDFLNSAILRDWATEKIARSMWVDGAAFYVDGMRTDGHGIWAAHRKLLKRFGAKLYFIDKDTAVCDHQYISGTPPAVFLDSVRMLVEGMSGRYPNLSEYVNTLNGDAGDFCSNDVDMHIEIYTKFRAAYYSVSETDGQVIVTTYWTTGVVNPNDSTPKFETIPEMAEYICKNGENDVWLRTATLNISMPDNVEITYAPDAEMSVGKGYSVKMTKCGIGETPPVIPAPEPDVVDARVEYSISEGQNGEIIVEYVALDKDGNDITDQIKTFTVGDSFFLTEE